MTELALKGDPKRNPVIGVWSTAERQRVRVLGVNGDIASGAGALSGWTQVSRLGNPLVNEVVVPAGLKDAFNASPPVKDADNQTIVNRVTNPEVPQLIQAIYGLPA